MSQFQTSFCNSIFPCLNFFSQSIRSRNRHDDLHLDGSAHGQLPTSVILEILLKLPIKCIIRCKCVCKTWYNLLSEPHFSRNYLTNPPFTTIVRSLHSTLFDPLDSECFCFLEIGRTGEVIHTLVSPRRLDFQKSGITGIVGSCNGFLCLVKSPQPGNERCDDRNSLYNNQAVCIVNPLMCRPHGENLMSFDPETRKCTKLDVSEVEGTFSFYSEYMPIFCFDGNCNTQIVSQRGQSSF